MTQIDGQIAKTDGSIAEKVNHPFLHCNVLVPLYFSITEFMLCNPTPCLSRFFFVVNTVLSFISTASSTGFRTDKINCPSSNII